MDSSSSSSSKKILSNHPSVRSSSSNTNPNPRIAILRWMSTLTPHQRQSHLTIVDANFIRILFQMYRRIQLTGHGFFLILPDIPSTSTPGLPSLIFRRSSGLLSRSSKRNQCEISIANALRLFGSKEGVGVERCEVDSLTVSEDFVADLDWFVKVMDVVSNGAFLRGDVDGSVVVGEWGEMKWLKDKGYYNLECFVANRIEIALRLAWMLGPGGGKKQKWPRLFREKSGDIAIAANLFWKRRGCVDWFMEMDPEIRKRVCLSFYGKRANYLVKEVLMTSDDLLKDGMFLLKSKPNPSQKSVERFASSQWGDQLLGNMDLEFSLHAIPEPISGTNSNKSNFMRSLIVMQQLLDMLLVCRNNEPDAEHIFFTSLSSSQTISDFIVRRLRGFLMLIFSEYIEFELTRDTTLSIPAKNTEEKSFAGSQRNKKKSRKRRGSTKKLADNNLTAKEPPKVQLKQQEHPIDPALLDLVCEISPAVPTNHNVTSLSQKEESIVRTNRKDHTTELINNKAHTPRKRKGVKSKNVVSEKINNKIISSQLGSFDISLPLHVSQSKVSESADTYNTLSCTLTNTEGQVNSPLKLCSSITDNGPDTKSDKEADKNLNIDNSSQSYIHSHSNDRHCQISDHTEIVSTSNLQCMNTRKNGNLIKERDSTVPRKCTYSANNKISTLACECETCIDTQTTYKGVSGFLTDNDVRHTSLNLSGHTMKNDHAMSQMENDSCNPHSQANVVSSIHFNSEADIMHLDAGHSQFNHLHQSLLSTTHQVRNVLTERACAVAIPSQTPPVSVDWPPVVRTCSRLSQLAAPNYESIINNTRLQPTICSGVPNNGMQFQPAVAHGNNERRHSEDVVDFPAFHNSSDMIDDTENYWVSDEEPDMHTLSGSDYNKYFGGGIMYWNTSDYVGTGFSRPPSHSSEDSSWAWYDADINRAIDDMVGLPGLPSYGVNGMASPLETLGPAQQSRGYLFSGTDINGMDSQVQGTDLPEELISRSLNTSNNSEGIKTDSLSYPILRPIIIPSALRKSSRSEFRINHDHRSPCFSSSRSDRPRRIKRPPSPMVLCVPHAPQVPPPSIGDSRKIRGFPVVRSGSSSPRHWGVRNWYHEEITSDHVHCCMDGPEVVWRPWQNKSLSRDEMMQNIPGSLMQDRLIVMSQQLGRDQEHPDVSFPVQPPESMNSSSWKASLTMMQNTLHEEINFFCRQVATESHSKKPFINWAVKRVARSLQVLWPRSQTNIYGSNATGLDLPTSDVDLVVCLPPVRNLEPIKEAGILEGRNGIKETCLQHAARYLANQEWVKSDSLKTIENTAIPLIMLVAEVPIDIIAPRGNISNSQSLEGLEASSSMMSVQSCNIISPAPVDLENNSPNLKDSYAYVKHVRLDISFKSPSHTGLQTTHLVRELTEQFPASIPLALILKQFLADRSLDHSNSGGLSSYCLVLLIIRFLQHEHHLGQLVNQNLGSLLMDFLYFFGNVFDPRQMRVSIQRSGFYINRERGQSIDPIHIDDPLCSMTNVGRNCFRIHQCIKAFADAYSVLETQITHFPCKSDNPIPIKLLPKIIPTIEHQGEI